VLELEHPSAGDVADAGELLALASGWRITAERISMAALDRGRT
jgi:hypothetical protein